MATFSSIYVVGTFPDDLNTNRNIRRYMAEGLREVSPSSNVHDVSVSEWRACTPTANDLCLFVGSILLPEFAIEAMLARAKRHGAKTAVWLHDDPYEIDASMRVIDLADIIFTCDRASLRHYPDQSPVFHLPLATSRKYLSLPIKRNGPDYTFIGYPYQNRIDFFRRFTPAEDANCAMRGMIVGPHWSSSEFADAIDLRIDEEGLNRLYSSSLSTLYLGRAHNLLNSRFCVRASTPGPRLFEAAAAGACQIAMTSGLEILDYFSDAEELILVEDPPHAYAAIQELQQDRGRSERIGERARARAVSEHLYAHRAQTLLAAIRSI